jgi:hypothetical protein
MEMDRQIMKTFSAKLCAKMKTKNKVILRLNKNLTWCSSAIGLFTMLCRTPTMCLQNLNSGMSLARNSCVALLQQSGAHL